MTNRIQTKRLELFQWLLVGVFVALTGWLAYLQGYRHEDLRKEAETNTRRRFFLEPRRGDILDIKKNILATSVFVKTVCANPQFVVGHESTVARAIAPLLQLPEQDVLKRLQMRYRTGENGRVITNRYVVLKSKVPVETWEKIERTMEQMSFGVDEKRLAKSQKEFYRNLHKAAIFTDPVDDQLRVYPNKALAAHVLGYVSTSIQTSGSNRFTTITGTDGIERSFNTNLCGVRGFRLTETDRKQKELVDLREQDVEPHDGLNVVLTIDSVVQHIAEEALAEVMVKHTPVNASAIVLRPRTGEILAMATVPNFDPNDLGRSTDRDRQNRIICDVMEPGSTFKIVVVSAALNERIVQLTDQFDCEHGHFFFAGRVLRDHDSNNGVLTAEQIITKSSNIGAAKIGIRLGEQQLYRYMREFGFGSRTGIPLGGEVFGIVHSVSNWSKVSIAQIPMGQGVAVTQLQMVMAMSAVANNGLLMRPMLVDRLEDRSGTRVVRFEPQRMRQVVSPGTARQMVQALKTVVAKDGTAPKAALDHYTVAGKTGTAQIAGPGGYQPGKYFSSFIGFFPADAPELCIAVFLKEPKQGYYGGQTAAPVFHQIATRAANYLSIKPDLEVEPDKRDGLAANQAARAPRTTTAQTAHPAND